MLKVIEETGLACWASYLINGDASGISEQDAADADAFQEYTGGGVWSTAPTTTVAALGCIGVPGAPGASCAIWLPTSFTFTPREATGRVMRQRKETRDLTERIKAIRLAAAREAERTRMVRASLTTTEGITHDDQDHHPGRPHPQT